MYKVSKNTELPVEAAESQASPGPSPIPPPPALPEEELSWWERAVRNSRLLRLLRGTGVPVDPIVDKATDALAVESVEEAAKQGVIPVPTNIPLVPLVTEKKAFSNYGPQGQAVVNAAQASMPAMPANDSQMGALAPAGPGAPVSPGPVPGQGMTRTGAYKKKESESKGNSPGNAPGPVQSNPMNPGHAPDTIPVPSNAATQTSLSVPGVKQSGLMPSAFSNRVKGVMNFFTEGAQNSKLLQTATRELKGVDRKLVNLAAESNQAHQAGVDAFQETLRKATGGAFSTPEGVKAQRGVLSEALSVYTDQSKAYHSPIRDGMSASDRYAAGLINPLSASHAAQADAARTALHQLNRAEVRATQAALPHVREAERLSKETKDLIGRKKILKEQVSELQPQVKRYQDKIDIGIGAGGMGFTATGLSYIHKEGSHGNPFERVMREKFAFASEASSVIRDLTTPFVGPAGNENLENLLAATGGMGLGAAVAPHLGSKGLDAAARRQIRPLRRIIRKARDANDLATLYGLPFRGGANKADRDFQFKRLAAEADAAGLDSKKLIDSVRKGGDLGDLSTDLFRTARRNLAKRRRIPGALLGGLAGLTGLGLMRDLAPTKQINRDLIRAQIDQMKQGTPQPVEPGEYMYDVATEGSGRFL